MKCPASMMKNSGNRCIKNKDYFKRIDNLFSTRIFHYKDIFLIGSGFVAVVIFLNILVRFICKNIIEFDCPLYWPISIFRLRIPDWDNLLVAIAVLLFFFCVIIYLYKIKYRVSHIIFAGIIIIFGTNLIQGWEGAFVTPIALGGENGIQYYHDAIKIKDPYYFLRHFEHLQPDLLTHSRTHPPGAVLTMYLLFKVFGNPGYITVVITIVSVFLSMLFLYGVLSTEFKDDDLSKYITFLFILIPGIQIYYSASIDALIASFLLGILFFFLHPKSSISITGSAIFIFMASFLTFGFLFILPIIVGFEVLKRRSVWRSGFIILSLGLIYIIIYIIFNFNYINSFIIATILNNPGGFRLLSEPASYIFTRLEGISEIILFFGPFLAVLMIRGIRIMKKTDTHLLTMTWLAVSTLLAMLVTGAFRTGETARICLFIYPYLIFPIASYLGDIRITEKEKAVLLSLVFVQTVLMQTFGTYLW
jgi:hypothetical protein